MPRISPKSQAKDVSPEHEPGGDKYFWRNEEGATAIEYGLIAALIALACIIAFTSLGLNLAGIFNTISDALKG
jgi:pilus assembly protein Flp/PilA